MRVEEEEEDESAIAPEREGGSKPRGRSGERDCLSRLFELGGPFSSSIPSVSALNGQTRA